MSGDESAGGFVGCFDVEGVVERQLGEEKRVRLRQRRPGFIRIWDAKGGRWMTMKRRRELNGDGSLTMDLQ